VKTGASPEDFIIFDEAVTSSRDEGAWMPFCLIFLQVF
jgi:hypothetical protein